MGVCGGGVYVVLASRARKLAGCRFLHLYPEGFAVCTKLLGRAHDLRWADIAAVEATSPADLLVHRLNKGRSHRISCAVVYNGPTHHDHLLAHVGQAIGNG